MSMETSPPRFSSLRIRLWLGLVTGWVSFVIVGGSIAEASTPVQAGYRDFSYGTSGISTPTAEKPESKLWFNDGFWWGSLYNPSAPEYHIYRLDLATQSWVDTGTALDTRSSSLADTLWDPATQKLYVVSHIFTTNGQPTSSSSQWGRLFRYSYNTGSQSYSLDSGFPVSVTHGKSETLVLAKDSTGRLWVTYVENSRVMVNHSVSTDTVWGDPYLLPVDSTATTLTSDDISSVISFQNNKIGLMWSNQRQKRFYFAVHLDGDVDTSWQMDQAGIPGPPCSGACGDDHINLKSIQVDQSGRVFAAIKTSLTSTNSPLIMLLVRNINGNWSNYVFGRVADHHTRPIVLLDEENARLYMFATAPESGGRIYYKTTDMNNINFTVGLGQPFIQSSTDTTINNSTSTKQNLNSTTGLLVLASDQGSKFYLHNYMSLGSTSTPPVANFSGSPTSGQAPLTVNFSDLSTGTPTSWSWNFGDGGTSTLRNPSHTYNGAGTYTVSLTATNAAGSNTATKTSYITVTAAPPSANFSGTPTTGVAPLTVNFSDLSSGTPTSWSWGFGDGGTSTQQNPSHTYSGVGSYTVSLTASNSDGSNTMTKSNYITVSSLPPPPTANFSGTPTTGVAPLTVNFSDLSSGTPTSWSWAFGDGGTSTQQNPSHTYIGVGSYTVSLTATNAAGPNTITKSDYITVSASGGSVVYQETQTGGSSASNIVSTSSSLTAVAGNLYLAAISPKPKIAVTGVSGLGLNWVQVRAQCAGRSQTAIEVWMAQGIPTGNGPVTATFASAPINAVIAVSSYSGVNSSTPIGNVVSGNTNGVNGVCSGGTDGSSYSFGLTTPVTGAVVYGAAAMRNRTHTPGPGYIERAEIAQGSSGDIAADAVEDQGVTAGSMIVNGSFSGIVDWAVIGVEIRP